MYRYSQMEGRLPMKSILRPIFFALSLLCFWNVRATAQQGPEVKFVADTLIVQAEGSYESDPDLAIMAFDVSVQEKELKQAYGKASQSLRTIVEVAERNGLAKDAIQTGVLTIIPMYDRSRKARAYLVEGHVTLKMQDFSKVGPIMDDAVQDGIADFHSLRYSLAGEEAAKKKAVADAMQRAVGRATVALEQGHQKLGPVRFVNLEVKNMTGIAEIHSQYLEENESSGTGLFSARKKAIAPPPPVQPGKITVTATIQCVFQIEK